MDIERVIHQHHADQEFPMFPFSEYYLQSELDYHRERISEQLRRPVRRRGLRVHLPGALSRAARHRVVSPSH